MNLYYVNMDVLKKVKGEADKIENTDFAIPAMTPSEALEKSKVYGPDGVLLDKVFKMGKDWDTAKSQTHKE